MKTKFKSTDVEQEALLCSHVTGIIKLIKDRDVPLQYPIQVMIKSEMEYEVAVNGGVPIRYFILPPEG